MDEITSYSQRITVKVLGLAEAISSIFSCQKKNEVNFQKTKIGSAFPKFEKLFDPVSSHTKNCFEKFSCNIFTILLNLFRRYFPLPRQSVHYGSQRHLYCCHGFLLRNEWMLRKSPVTWTPPRVGLMPSSKLCPARYVPVAFLEYSRSPHSLQATGRICLNI